MMMMMSIGGGTVGATASTTAGRMNRRSFSFPRFALAQYPLPAPATSSRRRIVCEVATGSDLSPSTSSEAAIGARVKVTVPLKVYHVPRVPEVDITGMEGELKQYVGLWKGKRISANLPYKVQFFVDVPGRGAVKFFVHLKEDEFEYL